MNLDMRLGKIVKDCWQILFLDGVVEYFGVEEEERIMVVLGFDDLVKV